MKDNYLDSVLGERENILLSTHQHWFTLAREIVVEIVLSIAVIVLITIIRGTLPQYSAIGWGYFILILPIISLLRDVMIWQNRKFVVSNRRVIQISGIINKNVIDSSLEKVNDVRMVQSFLGRLLNYGDVEIMTASELGVNKFQFINHPIQFKTAMLNAKQHLSNGDDLPSTNRSSDIPYLISQLDELRQKGVLTETEFIAKKTELLSKI